MTATTSAAAGELFDRLVREGHEGVVVKAPSAPYAAGRRGAGWIKVKPRHTLDLVVLAVEWGSGRRQGLLSNIHLGARDPDSGEFVMLGKTLKDDARSGWVPVGKTFKGMTDEMLAWQTERFGDLQIHDDGRVVTVRPEFSGPAGTAVVSPSASLASSGTGTTRRPRKPTRSKPFRRSCDQPSHGSLALSSSMDGLIPRAAMTRTFCNFARSISGE